MSGTSFFDMEGYPAAGDTWVLNDSMQKAGERARSPTWGRVVSLLRESHSALVEFLMPTAPCKP